MKELTILGNRPWYWVFRQCWGNDLRHVRRWERKWHNTIRDVLSCPITEGFHNWRHWVCRQLSFASHRFPGCSSNKVYIAIVGQGSSLSYVLVSFLCSTFVSLCDEYMRLRYAVIILRLIDIETYIEEEFSDKLNRNQRGFTKSLRFKRNCLFFKHHKVTINIYNSYL